MIQSSSIEGPASPEHVNLKFTDNNKETVEDHTATGMEPHKHC